jgi:serine/threonine-protein kinase
MTEKYFANCLEKSQRCDYDIMMVLQSTADVIARLGEVFTVFDQQDSANISYGVRDAHGRRWFVKTAGAADVSPGGHTRDERATLLRRDAQLHADIAHPALLTIHDVIDTSDGVAVRYDWFDGELLNAPAERRNDPAEAHQRFASLPPEEIVRALDSVIDLHVALEAAGWIANDFYDGCLMYNFAARAMKVIDFECYRRGAFVNDQGRLMGSTRFMAPEELTRGATIDSRTMVFNLARMIEIFVLVRHELPEIRAVTARATMAAPADRYESVASFHEAWRQVAMRAFSSS